MNKKYSEFYQSIINKTKCDDTQFIILTHTVSDIIEFTDAINELGTIELIISIPYSKDVAVYNHLSKKYKMVAPNLESLLDKNYLKELVLAIIDTKKPLVIVEIGGYFSSVINDINDIMPGNLLGVIEDTEAGHRRYENISNTLPCPVFSVARSFLKECENFLVAQSCFDAAKNLLETINFKFKKKAALVLGYGKIGQGLSQILKDNNFDVLIFDTDASKRLLALSRGFKIPEKKYALEHADFIFGASGEQSINNRDFELLKNGSTLFSCSSKKIEFDINFLKDNYKIKKLQQYVDMYESKNNYFYVVADGQPVNFATKGHLVGSLISLVHAEMLAGIIEILKKTSDKVLQEIPHHQKSALAEKWIAHFYNEMDQAL